MDAVIASSSLLALTSSVSVFNSFMPPFVDVTNSQPNHPHMLSTLRTSEIASGALCVSIGLVGSILTKSPYPALLAILAAGALVVMYETALKSKPSTV